MSISVSCACGKKLKAKTELAGRRVKCPACEQALTIPSPEPVAPSLDPLGIGELDLESAEDPNAPTITQCPSCRAVMAENAILCVKCGFDHRIGEQRDTQHGEMLDKYPAEWGIFWGFSLYNLIARFGGRNAMASSGLIGLDCATRKYNISKSRNGDPILKVADLFYGAPVKTARYDLSDSTELLTDYAKIHYPAYDAYIDAFLIYIDGTRRIRLLTHDSDFFRALIDMIRGAKPMDMNRA